MSEGEKLHKLLEFIAKTEQKTYTFEELIPAFKYGLFKKPNTTEIKRLCALLVRDELVSSQAGSHPGIVIKPLAIAAYYDSRYFQEEKKTLSRQALLVAALVTALAGGTLLWIYYLISDRNERLGRAEETDRQRLKQIESLTKSSDSLQSVVKSQGAELAKMKKEAEESRAKATVVKKKKR